MNAGKLLIIVGVMLVIVGVLIRYSDKLPFLGRLPGDIVYERGNVKIYIPLVTSIVLSLLLSLAVYIAGRLK